MLVKRESGDQEMIAEKERRETAYDDITLLLSDSQENQDIQMLHGMGFIRSGNITDPSSHFTMAGIFAYMITEDGRELLAEQRGTRSERQPVRVIGSPDEKKSPTAFISYSWDDESHKDWVKELATRLREDRIDAKLDQWEVSLGDSITKFMGSVISESDFVVIICTPRNKERSDKGVGFEGSVITGEVLANQSDRNKFIPVLRSGEWTDAAPSWILELAYADLSESANLERGYARLRDTLLGRTETAPLIPATPRFRPSR